MTRAAVVQSLVVVLTLSAARAEEPPKPKDTQAETIRLTTPDEALKSLKVPDGFRVSLFASEPAIRNPIGIATDPKGRLWVAENFTYAERPLGFDLSQHDRILVLEDADHDGKAESRKVFWDQAQKLTSVEVGFGGVWALCPPQLLFIPDRNGDDVPDSAPEVVLDGWDHGAVGHNIANGLRWGPDGWLYGRHGIQATSQIGAPGTPKDARIPINCGIWRYHPTRKIFEVVCRGGTNSWGADWDAHGELFYINTVIGHLWQGLPGAFGQRMYGQHDNPRLYAYLAQNADHFHWDTAETWDKIRSIGVSPTTDQAGGGHAHTGLLIYQGDNWPEKYQGTLFTINLHGHRINTDHLERKGTGFVGRHGADFLKTSDPWFRPIDLISGSDGGVYLADWTDIGECHENDGVHRSSGRIYKITYGDPKAPAVVDVSRLGGPELVALQARKNDWYARQGRLALQQLAASGKPMEAIHAAALERFNAETDSVQKLRALWCLYATGGTSDDWLVRQLGQADEYVRCWAIRLLADGKTPSPEAMRAFASMAPKESSGLVLLYLAATLQKMPTVHRWPLAEALAGRSEYANDPMFPLMLWYGVEAAVPDDPARAVRLAGSSGISLLSRFIARRLTENLERVPGPVDALVTLAGQPDSPRTPLILAGMSDALNGWRKAKAPSSWAAASKALSASKDEDVRRRTRELSVVFGDGRALDDLLKIAGSGGEPGTRREAVRVLVEARDAKVVPILRNLLGDRDLSPDAARGLAAFDDPENARLLLSRFGGLSPAARAEALVTLCARPASALALLDAVASGSIDREKVSAFQVRQMLTMPDERVRRRVGELWPANRAIPAAKRAQIDRLKGKLEPQSLASANLAAGRGQFVKACATCHTLFGQGGKIGPDLTGAQRANLEYLLENIVEPSATVTADYRMSTVSLSDGRLLNGVILGSRTGPTLTIQTPTERLVVDRSDVDGIKDSSLSLMPEGLLDPLSDKDLRDLIAYLMSPQQAPLPVDSVGK